MQMMWEEISFSFYYFINIFLIFIYILNLIWSLVRSIKVSHGLKRKHEINGKIPSRQSSCFSLMLEYVEVLGRIMLSNIWHQYPQSRERKYHRFRLFRATNVIRQIGIISLNWSANCETKAERYSYFL